MAVIGSLRAEDEKLEHYFSNLMCVASNMGVLGICSCSALAILISEREIPASPWMDGKEIWFGGRVD